MIVEGRLQEVVPNDLVPRIVSPATISRRARDIAAEIVVERRIMFVDLDSYRECASSMDTSGGGSARPFE